MAEVINLPKTSQMNVSKRFLHFYVVFLEMVMVLSSVLALSMLICSIAIGKEALGASWGKVTYIGMYGGGIIFLFTFIALVHIFSAEYREEFIVFGPPVALKNAYLLVLKFIYCTSGKCVAVSLVLGSVAVICFLMAQSFSLEDKVLALPPIVIFITTLIASWTFIGAIAWLYFECSKPRIKDRNFDYSFQIVAPADEKAGKQDEIAFMELAQEGGGKQKKIGLEGRTDEVCKQEDIKLKFQ